MEEEDVLNELYQLEKLKELSFGDCSGEYAPYIGVGYHNCVRLDGEAIATIIIGDLINEGGEDGDGTTDTEGSSEDY